MSSLARSRTKRELAFSVSSDQGFDPLTLTEIPFDLDTSQVTTMNSMFAYFIALKTIPKMDTSKVTSMDEMFLDCFALESIPKMDTSKVTSMRQTFQNCQSLVAVPEIDTSQVVNMNSTLYNCYSLAIVPPLDASSATDVSHMLNSCEQLTDGHIKLIRSDGTKPEFRDGMIEYSGLTREPFYLPDGTPI
ncbi:BspA family leucine-rich repeat surface protein [Corynebacterium auriscanis]|uniref:BspA family leucine-rich repeat surface protein n=1 Tax=Corynebacterium auriscanis TaxID=99807 RepID=UPI003CF3BA66